MTLEDRVRVLEDEVGILKDQIRNTLLEIQEQILIHYYPSLRADPSPADGGALLSRGNPTARNASTFTGLQRVAIDSSGPTPEEPERETLPPAGQGHSPWSPEPPAELAEQARDPSPEPAAHQPAATHNTVPPPITRLMEWASDSVEKLGRERTIRAIEAYAKGGYLDPAIKDTLLQLLALSDEPALVERVSLRVIAEILRQLNEILGHEPDLTVAQAFLEEAHIG